MFQLFTPVFFGENQCICGLISSDADGQKNGCPSWKMQKQVCYRKKLCLSLKCNVF